MEVGQGRVLDRPFARTIYAIAAQRFTGDLLLHDGERRYKTSWEDGRVVAAESAAPADSPGRVALSAGLVTSTDVSRVLDAVAHSPGADPVEVLVELCRLKPDQVTTLKRRLLAQRAARCFALVDAAYTLDNARSLVADPDVPPIDARWLVYFGLRTHYTVDRLEREMGGLLDRGLRLADDAVAALPAFAFGDRERPVMDRLAMRVWTPRQLIASCAGIDGRQVLSIVYALLACDCLEPGQVTASPTVPPPVASGTPAARGTENDAPQPAVPEGDTSGTRRGRPGSGSSAPAVPGAAEHARLAHGTVRRLLFPGQGTGAPPAGDALTAARRRRATSRPPPSETPFRTGSTAPPPETSGRPGSTPPPDARRSGSTPPPPDAGRRPGSTPPPDARRPGSTPPPRTSRTSSWPPASLPVRSSRTTGPPPVGPESTNPRTRTEPNATSPIEPPSSRTRTEPNPGTPVRPQTTGSPPVRHSRDTQPPPMAGSLGRQRPHSTTHPPILRRSHSMTSTIPPESMHGAAAEIRKMIADKISSLERGADHYSILGVTQMAKGDEIRAAYFGIAKRIHPDRLRAVGVTDVGPDAQRLFARINQAFGVLSDPQRRAEYSVMLAAGGEDAVRKAQADAEEHAGRVLRAEETFRRGEMALRRSQFESARMLFEEAVELNGEEAEYHALLAWATWLAAPNKQLVAVDVQKRLAQALAMSPQCVPAHFYCGQVAKHSGQVQAALDSFRVVVDLEPDHVEANLELRVLRGRMRKR